MRGEAPVNPLVSVIVNCFNGEEYLAEALDSIKAQTYTNWEIIFWDNMSTDASAQIAREFDPRLRYFKSQEMVGLGAARKLAVEQTNGKFLAFLDCDDLWMPEKLEKQVRVMEESGCTVCYGGVVKINADGKAIGQQIPNAFRGNLFDRLLRNFEIHVPAVMVRRASMVAIDVTFDEHLTTSEEYGLFMQLAVTYPFVALEEPVASYRIHDSALTNRSISQWANEREFVLDKICQKHPLVRQQYRNGLRKAYGRSGYYRARYLVSEGKRSLGRKALKDIWSVDYRYLLLYFLLYLPSPIWNLAHRLRTNRSRFS
jgi:glycosyltransferase involved in cell wall biosynthesis